MNPIVWQRLRRYLRTGDLIALGILAGRGVRVVQLDHVLIMGRAVGEADLELDAIRARRPELTTRFALAADLDLLCGSFPHHAEAYADRMRAGDACLLVESGSQPLAFTWLKLDGEVVITELGCHVALPRGGVWEYDTFVRPEARLGGVFVVLMGDLLAELRRRGAGSIFGTITHTNRASRLSHQRVGYRLALTLSRVWMPGLSFCRSAHPGSRPCYTAFARRAPELRIDAPDAAA